MRFLFSDYFLIGLLAAISIFTIAILPTIWYVNNQGVDTPLHFAGGLWVGLLFLALFGRFKELAPYSGFIKSRLLLLAFTVAIVALVGVGWELYEFVFNNIGPIADTMGDLSLDLIGGLTAALAGMFVFRK